MKKLSLLLLFLLVLSLATGSLAAGLVFANTPKSTGIAWWDRMEVGNKRYIEASGNEVYQVGPAGAADAAVQLQVVEDAIASGVDALTVIPSSPESLEPVLKKAMDQGIVVISHEAEIMQNVHYDLEAFNNYEYGAHMMDVLAAEMGEEGGYMIMVGMLTMTSHQQWAEGAIKRQQQAYPKMFQVADRVESAAQGGSQEGSYLVAKEVITKYPDIKGFIGCDMINPPGIAQAVEEAGKAGKIAVTGTCLVSVARQYLENGTIKTISFWDPADAGQAMCTLAEMVVNEQAIENGINLKVPGYEKCAVNGKIVVGSAWVDVTKGNMADYDF